jgi:glucuronate isomerase
MANSAKIHLPEDRYFDPDPKQKEIALSLYRQVADKPLVCPHGHVDPRMFADPDYQFGTPADLLLIPDHYIFRMLYSQGIPMESLGLPRVDGGAVETDHRKIWQIFAEHFHLFRGRNSAANRRSGYTIRSPNVWRNPNSARAGCSSGSTSRSWRRPTPRKIR